MSTYDNLPVYKVSYDLLLIIFSVVKEFAKEYKYTLWDSIKKEIIDLISNIYRANISFSNRLVCIKQARENIEIVRLYIRLTKDLKQLNIPKFAEINEKIESISKQLLYWEWAYKSKEGQNLVW